MVDYKEHEGIEETIEEENTGVEKEPDLGSEEALNRPSHPYHEQQEKVREEQENES